MVGTVRVASIYSVGLHHMSRYVRTFGERYPGASVRLEYLHPTRVVESVFDGGGRAGPDLVPEEVARADGDPLARGGDGPGRPPVAPVRRRGGGRRRASSTARRSSASTPTCRSAGRSTGSCGTTTSRSRWPWSSTTSRTSSAPSRSRPGVAILPEPTLAARGRGRDAGRGPDRRPGPDHRLTRPLAIIHRRNHQLGLTASRFLEAPDRRGRARVGRRRRPPPSGDGHAKP